MKPILFLVMFAAGARAQDSLPPEDAEQKKIIDTMRVKAAEYSKDLPDFQCVQVTRKNEDPTGTSRHWRLTETIHEAVTETGGKESFAEMRDGKATPEGNRQNGLIAPSSFADVLHLIFDVKSHAEFAWNKYDTIRGRKTTTFAYAVTPDNSTYTIGRKKELKVAFGGMIDVDNETGSILKVTLVALGIPKNFPIQAMSNEYYFDYIKLGEHYFLVPLKADLQTRENKSLTWTEVEFREYRKP